MNKPALVASCFMVLSCNISSASSPSSYAGQEGREIKALAPEDIQGYLGGKGMGLAKAAELNGYPGPSHVLAMAKELALTDDQKTQTEALFKSMESKAISLGHDLVEEEAKLDREFSTKSISTDSLSRSLKRIGELQAELREVHLEAHLAQFAILKEDQVSKYISLRGYASHDAHKGHEAHNH